MWKVQLFKLNFDARETAAAAATIDSGWLTMGERVIAFESRFAAMLEMGSAAPVHCLAVTNCTAALHMAVLAAGIGPGDEVVVPGLTFVADANVVRMAGGTPVFADCVSADDLNVSVADIERKITSRTKAVIAVHYAGFACDIEAIAALCARRGLVLIEDVAHAPGASLKGQALGTFGDIGCFSFFSNKNLSIGEGGLVCTRNDAYFGKLRGLRSHGMTTLTLDRHKGRAFSYDVVEPGGNFRMDEVHAAIGLVQLEKLPAANAARRSHTDRYRRLFEGIAVGVPFLAEGDTMPAYHIMPIILPSGASRQRVMEAMKTDGIQSSIHYPPFWSFQAYASMADPATMPVIAAIAERQLTLPLYPTMTSDDVEAVATSLKRALEAEVGARV